MGSEEGHRNLHSRAWGLAACCCYMAMHCNLGRHTHQCIQPSSLHRGWWTAKGRLMAHGKAAARGLRLVRRSSMARARGHSHGERKQQQNFPPRVLVPGPYQHLCCCMQQQLGLWPAPRRATLHGPALVARSSRLSPCSRVTSGKSLTSSFSEREMRTNGVGSSQEGKDGARVCMAGFHDWASHHLF
jgi:hypothetical protein